MDPVAATETIPCEKQGMGESRHVRGKSRCPARANGRHFLTNLRRDRWAYPPQRSLLRSAEVGHPGWVFSISCQQPWFENSIWSVRLITLRFVIRLFVTPSTTREQELPYSYDGGEAAVNGGFHAWR